MALRSSHGIRELEVAQVAFLWLLSEPGVECEDCLSLLIAWDMEMKTAMGVGLFLGNGSALSPHYQAVVV